ncbi:CIC11C00000002500 [Sungouiella intermedia]|uniref:CIC11C00000002500 n=1 Tax=Sungouiella intermedia TaxID=45354 RepID=A0A1L0FTC6_9ASCO|nr:CIC11C00000002500 [[Candida] intermedia]
MVQSLYEIALWKCIQLSARITDVGDIPYHRVKPVLKRLNAKQLIAVEENSPAIMPESDELWSGLIERDFPDRPSKAKFNLVSPEDDAMPNKSLYEKYADEREELRASSAQRLRKMTQKLQKEKSRNSIVPIQGIMREPVVRRRMPAMSLATPLYSKYGSKSILGKAMKDVQHRHLMFKSSSRSDPFAAFSAKKNDNAQKRAQVPRVPSFQVAENGPTGIYSQKPLGPSPQNATGTSRPGFVYNSARIRGGVVSSPNGVVSPPNGARSPLSGSSSPKEVSPNPDSRKRKQTSIFLSSKRLPRAPRIPLDRPRRTEEKTKQRDDRPVEKPGAPKLVRSSIFY